VESLRFEIEWGIRRWLALEGITEHTVYSYRGWVEYYDAYPPGVEFSEVDQLTRIGRWYQKSRTYEGQQEYRLAWEVHSPQVARLPDKIDIELTKTGLGLFEPWSPPTQ